MIGLTSLPGHYGCLLCGALLLITICSCSTIDAETEAPDHIVGGVNFTQLFADPTDVELRAVEGEWALRSPFLIAAAVHFALLAYALPRINTERIERARAHAETGVGHG
jgi:hypothetical protein